MNTVYESFAELIGAPAGQENIVVLGAVALVVIFAVFFYRGVYKLFF